MRHRPPSWLALLAGLLSTHVQAAPEAWSNALWSTQDHHHYVSFKPQTPATPVPRLPEAIGGRLLLPAKGAANVPAPAVLVLHGSAGADSRTARYAEALRLAGFVTLEADIWQAMGVTAATRPRTVQETMPSVWGGLNYLAGRPEVDAQRIGVLGFSWGGVQTLLAAREPAQAGRPKFAAFAAQYPICWAYNRVPGYELNQVSGPLQIGIGERDDYDEGSAPCRALAQRLDPTGQQVRVIAYPASTHGFDRLEPEQVVNDPYSHFGQGGQVTMRPQIGQGIQSILNTVQFFKRSLAPR